VALAENAWAYATRSRSRYSFVLDAYRLGARICRAGRVDIITAQDPFATGLVAWLLARRFGKPLNLQVHFDVIDNPHWLRERPEHRALNVLAKWLLRRAATVRVGTTREREQLAAGGIPRERIFVAPVPVDLDRFSAAQPDETLRRQVGGDALVLNVSRLVPQKDLPTLLRAAQQVVREYPGARFAIAGDGPLRRPLAALAAELGLQQHVCFLGNVDRNQIPVLLAAADALAVSSVYEGTSLATVEAAAAGKPVVTTDVAGASDTVVDGITGYVVPVGDAAALAGALERILGDPTNADQMGAAAREHVRRHFGTEPAVSEVIRMWRATAATRSP
jgi:glycosyltransferase involved in cell wall biosynthesis